MKEVTHRGSDTSGRIHWLPCPAQGSPEDELRGSTGKGSEKPYAHNGMAVISVYPVKQVGKHNRLQA